MFRTLCLWLSLCVALLAAGPSAALDLLPAPKPSGRLLVFVHGIIGSAEDTWTNKEAKAYWPDLVRGDKTFERADIFVYRYASGLESDSATITDIADQFGRDLEEDAHVSKYDSVVFVAHSMGGIVVRKYLLDEARKEDGGILADDRVKGLLLFATPMDGSAVANLASEISRSPTLWKLGKSTDPEGFLQQLRRDWINDDRTRNILSDCAFETKGVVSLWIFDAKVVERDSAEYLCNHRLTGIPDRDHNQIVKPEDTTKPPHDLLRAWYRSIFPDQELPADDVVFAQCTHEPYGEDSLERLQSRLFDLSVSYHKSLVLPVDWSKTAPALMWDADHPPRLVVIHYSCFQDTARGSGKAYEERRIDFNSFLASLVDTPIRVLAYSRAFDARFVPGENFTKANMAAMFDTGRLQLLPLEQGRVISDAEVDAFGRMVVTALAAAR